MTAGRRPVLSPLALTARVLTWAAVAVPLTVALLGGSACSVPVAPTSAPVRFTTPRLRAGMPLVVVLAPPNRAVLPFDSSLRSELAEDFDVLTQPVEGEQEWAQATALLEQRRPPVVVLVDNRTVAAYRSWALKQPKPPAALIVMSSFADELQGTVPNAMAISWETPAVTSVAGLRTLLKRPVASVGVVYRERFLPVLERERLLLASERIELLLEPLSPAPSSAEVTRGLKRLWRRGMDALWVINDDALMGRELLAHAWLPFAERAPVPIVVGVPSLVGEHVHFGVYAVAPDPEALGVQTADLVVGLREHGYRAWGRRVLPPASTRTSVDWELARALGAPPALEGQVDVVVGAKAAPKGGPR